jgi:hypothetical protein
VKIFGREPALVIGTIVAIISLAGTLGFSFLTADQAGLWIVVVNAIAAAAMAWLTRPLQPGIYTYAVGAILALVTAYGLTLTPEQVNAVNALVVPVLALLTRGQVSPVETAVTKPSLEPTPEAQDHEAGKAADEAAATHDVVGVPH